MDDLTRLRRELLDRFDVRDFTDWPPASLRALIATYDPWIDMTASPPQPVSPGGPRLRLVRPTHPREQPLSETVGTLLFALVRNSAAHRSGLRVAIDRPDPSSRQWAVSHSLRQPVVKVTFTRGGEG